MRYPLRLIPALLLAVLVLAAEGRPAAQYTGKEPVQTNDNSRNQEDLSRDPVFEAAQRRAAKARDELRQQQIVNDTDKLLRLARQLDASVGSSPGKAAPTRLSEAQLKQVSEIERLAHSVKEKMLGQ